MESIKKTHLRSDASSILIEEALLRDESRDINIINWEDYSEKVLCSWKLMYGPDALFITFETQEPWLRALYTGDDKPVCEDSCVEFFVTFDDEIYYNFEYNPIGACTIEKGKGRHQRTLIRTADHPLFRIWTSEANQPIELSEREESWQVWSVIPYTLFSSKFDIQKIRSFKANFYKCGEALPNKHYLSWAPIKSERPDFHRPEFFAELCLELV